MDVKQTQVRYPLRVVRYDVDREKNPWGLALAGFASAPERIEVPAPRRSSHENAVRHGGPGADPRSLLGPTAGADAIDGDVPDRVVWDRTPIRVVLPVGAERMVHFPAHAVRVGVPDHLPLRTMSVDGTVYWLAHAPFAPVRVVVQGLDEAGGHYLLDLEAQPSASRVPLQIMRPGAGADPAAHRRWPGCPSPPEPRLRGSDALRGTADVCAGPAAAGACRRSARWHWPRTRSHWSAAVRSRRSR
jgi:hypothetical protein